MKWFKHITDSGDDPFIFELMEQFGADGYYVYFRILEIYGREFKAEDNWKLDISFQYICNKICFTKKNTLKKILDACAERKKFCVKFDGARIEIFIPKFLKILDEATLKKLRLGEQKSGKVPDELHKDSDDRPDFLQESSATDVDVDGDIDKERVFTNVKTAEPTKTEPPTEEATPPPSASNSKHFSNNKKIQEFVVDIKTLCLQIQGFDAAKGKFNPFQFVQSSSNNGIHPAAIIQALQSLLVKLQRKDEVNFWPYCKKIIRIQSGKYHEQDHIDESEEFKQVIVNPNLCALFTAKSMSAGPYPAGPSPPN